MMKLWALVGLFSVVGAPLAAAATSPVNCQPESGASVTERLAPSAQLADGDQVSGGGWIAPSEGAAPTRVVAPTAEREADAAEEIDRQRRPKPRKRDTRLPDAVLIGRGGTL